MNANFGIMHLNEKCKKHERKEKFAAQALSRIQEIQHTSISKTNWFFTLHIQRHIDSGNQSGCTRFNIAFNSR